MNDLNKMIEGTWKEKHKEVIEDLLKAINNSSDKYILKGGTSLMECYGLNRFSEDIDFDSTDKSSINKILQNFTNSHGYNLRIAKDTDTVKRFMIDYGGKNEYGPKPLKVEISYRKKNIFPEETTVINGINVYNIDTISIMKAGAYSARDKIRDLYDVAFIVNNKLDQLNPITIQALRNALEFKGLEQFDYIINTQHDELINTDVLAEMILNAFDKLDLISDKSYIQTEKQKGQYITKTPSMDEVLNDAKNRSNFYNSCDYSESDMIFH